MTTSNAGIYVDEKYYNVGIVYGSMSRSFEIKEGSNSFTALSGKKNRDILGTSYSYEFEVIPIPSDYMSYYEFYDMTQELVKYHIVQLPFGDSFIKFEAIITVSSDVFKGKEFSNNTWSSLKVTIKPNRYQIIAENPIEYYPLAYNPSSMPVIDSNHFYMDGTIYSLFAEYESIKRTGKILEGNGTATTLTGKVVRDFIGNDLEYKITIKCDPAHKNSYNSFYEALTKPIPCHSFVFPYNGKEVAFYGYVTEGNDSYLGYTKNDPSSPSWDNLELTISLYKPIYIRHYIANSDIGNIVFDFSETHDISLAIILPINMSIDIYYNIENLLLSSEVNDIENNILIPVNLDLDLQLSITDKLNNHPIIHTSIVANAEKPNIIDILNINSLRVLIFPTTQIYALSDTYFMSADTNLGLEQNVLVTLADLKLINKDNTVINVKPLSDILYSELTVSETNSIIQITLNNDILGIQPDSISFEQEIVSSSSVNLSVEEANYTDMEYETSFDISSTESLETYTWVMPVKTDSNLTITQVWETTKTDNLLTIR